MGGNSTNRNKKKNRDHILNIAIITADEIKKINLEFRKKDKATNILSFPKVEFIGVDSNTMGELLICPEVIETEALLNDIDLESHWAHLTVHGTLHLFGYDHITDSDALIMKNIEIDCMLTMGYSNPYGTRD